MYVAKVSQICRLYAANPPHFHRLFRRQECGGNAALLRQKSDTLATTIGVIDQIELPTCPDQWRDERGWVRYPLSARRGVEVKINGCFVVANGD